MKNWMFGIAIGMFAAGSPLANGQEAVGQPPLGAKTVAPTTGAAANHQPTTTEITADEQTTFDPKTNTAVFNGHVKVTDPRFSLTCDKLTAVLKSTSQKAAEPAPDKKKEPPVDPSKKQKPEEDQPANHQPADGDQSSSIDHVIAVGNVVIIQQKQDKDGKSEEYIGKGAKAVYDSKTGNIELSGWPSVQQGANLQVATEESTTMVMNRDTGAMKTHGASKTVITQENGAKK